MRSVSVVCIAALAGVCSVASAGKDKEWMLPKNDEGRYYLQEVVEVPGVSADELFDRAMVWIADAYVSANDVVQYSEKSNHEIIAKGSVDVWLFTTRVTIRHTLTIETKDGRARYTVDDLWQTTCDCSVAKWNMKKKAIFADVRSIGAELKDALLVSHAEEDW